MISVYGDAYKAKRSTSNAFSRLGSEVCVVLHKAIEAGTISYQLEECGGGGHASKRTIDHLCYDDDDDDEDDNSGCSSPVEEQYEAQREVAERRQNRDEKSNCVSLGMVGLPNRSLTLV